MVQEITNKTLAFLLVGAIVISLFGTFISLSKLNAISPGLQGITGLATNGTGYVQLDVQSLASFRIEAATVDFGQITPNSTGFWISTESSNAWSGSANNCSEAAGPCAGIEIENDGNEVINISFNTTADADSLIGGTSPELFFKVVNGSRSGTLDGCNGTIPYGVWTNLTSNTLFEICNGSGNAGYSYIATGDRVTIEFNLTIPNDAPQRTSQANITIWNLP